MSDEKELEKRLDGFQNGSDEDLNETIDAEHESSGYASALTVNADRDLRQYVSSGQLVHTSDVLMLEVLPDEMCHEQNSAEELETMIFYEYPKDLDEENCSHIPQAYFDNTDNFRYAETSKLSSLQEILSSANYEEKNKSLKVPNKRKGKGIQINTNKALKNSNVISHTGNRKKMKDDADEKKSEARGKSQVVENPCTQIYEIPNIKPKKRENKLNFIFSENESDEFADIEDNARDSSSDNTESFPNEQNTSADRHMKYTFGQVEKQEQKSEIAEKYAMRNKNVKVYNSSEGAIGESNAGGMWEDKNIQNAGEKKVTFSHSLQSASKLIKYFPTPKTADGKEKSKCGMPTITEFPESEDENISNLNQPSHSKARPLKIKAKVGSRKDKCNICNVRLGLCAIKCRCGGYYCAKHRYDKEHNCTFDYKTVGAEEIRRNNPKVIAEKVRKL